MIRRFEKYNLFYFLIKDAFMVKILIGGHLNMLANFGKLIQIILNF